MLNGDGNEKGKKQKSVAVVVVATRLQNSRVFFSKSVKKSVKRGARA